MPDPAEYKDFMEQLRAKTEQEDIRQYLKRTLGGYTKASVTEYLALLRKQQQTMAETFARNQQALFEEKEALKSSNETLTANLRRMEAEYRNLSDLLRVQAPDGGPSDLLALRRTVAALEEELARSGQEKRALEQQLERQKSVTEDYARKLEQSGQEKLSLQTALQAEMLESKKQRSAVARLTGEISEKETEIKFLKAMAAEGELAALRGKIADLTRQLETQTEFLAGCNEEAAAQSEQLETLHEECRTLRRTVADLTETLEQLTCQNDRLLLANRSLSGQLEQEYKRSIALIQEKSHLTADKLTAVRKLEEAGARLAVLDLELQRRLRGEQKEEIFEQAGAKSSCPG